jgi:hypothetical protein
VLSHLRARLLKVFLPDKSRCLPLGELMKRYRYKSLQDTISANQGGMAAFSLSPSFEPLDPVRPPAHLHRQLIATLLVKRDRQVATIVVARPVMTWVGT